MSEVVSHIYDNRCALLCIKSCDRNEDCITVAMHVANPLLHVLPTVPPNMLVLKIILQKIFTMKTTYTYTVILFNITNSITSKKTLMDSWIYTI